MTFQPKHIAIIGSGVFLIGLGFAILYWHGIPPLQEVNNSEKHTPCENIEICIPKQIGFAFKDSNGNIGATISGTVNLKSNYTFTVDRYFSYNIDMVSSVSDFKQLMFAFVTDEERFANMNQTNPNILIKEAKSEGRFVNTTLNNGHFTAKGIWQYAEPTTVKLFGFAVWGEKNITPLGKSQPVITLVSQADLIDAKRNFESEKTNKIVLALTWIGIGLAPILLGADFIVRVLLRDG